MKPLAGVDQPPRVRRAFQLKRHAAVGANRTPRDADVQGQRRPFRWSRLLLTYLFPVIPTVAFIDGVVSCLRTYTPDELRELARSVDGATGYDWTAGHAGGGPIPMTYLVGTPVRRQRAAP